jgi:Protein of unknown function (DUF1064)
MPYRYTEQDIADIKARQGTDLANFQRNSGRGLPDKTVRAMEKAAGVKMDEHGAPVPKKLARRQKYGNLLTEADGIKFQSRLEAKYYVELDLRRKAGEVLYFLRQVPFHLPGGVIYRVDFQIVLPFGIGGLAADTAKLIEYVDCKGIDTQDSKNKIKMVQAIYGVKIEIVRKVKSHRTLPS